jgi:hypothetical protein
MGTTAYLSSAVCFLLALTCISLFLEQEVLSFLLFISSVLLGVVWFPKYRRLWKQGLIKGYEVDFSAPLKARDFFTTKGWLVMVSRWGIWKAVLLRSLLTGVIIGGLLSIFSLLGVMSMIEVVTTTIIAIIGSSIYHYWRFNKSLSLLKGDLDEK